MQPVDCKPVYRLFHSPKTISGRPPGQWRWSKSTLTTFVRKFRTESVGVRGVALKIEVNDDEVNLARCCLIPTMRYSVLNGSLIDDWYSYQGINRIKRRKKRLTCQWNHC